MIISMIVAMDQNGLIGNESGMPWHLPADLKRFRRVTLGKPILMGRKTHEMIGKALDGRPNLIITRNQAYSSPGCTICHSLEEALQKAAALPGGEAMIIGGGQIYKEAIPSTDRLYLTLIQGNFQGTTWFPRKELLQHSWSITEKSTHSADEKNKHSHTYLIADKTSDQCQLKPILNQRSCQ